MSLCTPSPGRLDPLERTTALRILHALSRLGDASYREDADVKDTVPGDGRTLTGR
ncbi:hypothetical protein [Streptomyces sp. NPDC001604]|uniref:hypothetical protein n=1 Tax=Streptomyces sp. NPDC001604 TaxID=3364593 RepID=UPI00368D7446